MKKTFLLVFLLIMGLTSCLKDEGVYESYENQLAIDIDKITTYLSEHNLTAEVLASGVHYIIEEEGTDPHPTINSIVEVQYVGTFLDGSEFDSGTIDGYQLGSLIPGWQLGLQLFGVGGHGKLFIPSGLGYGPAGRTTIPANAVLIFDISLLSVSENN